jgi:hypothetical protein
MKIKKEYEKFFDRKKNDLCVHDAEDVIAFAEHYQALQLQQGGVSGMLKSFVKYAKNRSISDINIDDDTIDYFIEDFNLH